MPQENVYLDKCSEVERSSGLVEGVQPELALTGVRGSARLKRERGRTHVTAVEDTFVAPPGVKD